MLLVHTGDFPMHENDFCVQESNACIRQYHNNNNYLKGWLLFTNLDKLCSTIVILLDFVRCFACIHSLEEEENLSLRFQPPPPSKWGGGANLWKGRLSQYFVSPTVWRLARRRHVSLAADIPSRDLLWQLLRYAVVMHTMNEWKLILDLRFRVHLPSHSL